MKIKMNNAADLGVIALASGNGDFVQKTDYETKEVKKNEDGKVLYSAGKLISLVNTDGSGAANDIFISFTSGGHVEFGNVYELVGPLTITPFVSNSKRQAYSIQAEGLKPKSTKGGE